MTIQDMMAKRATLWNSMKEFLDKRQMENGNLNSEDAAEYARMEAEMQSMSDSIGRMQRAEQLAAELDTPVNAPILNRPDMGTRDTKVGRASKVYAADMLNAIRGKFLNVTDALNTGSDAEGGYLVPEEWDPVLHDRLEETNCMRRLSTVINTSGERKINLTGDKPQAQWLDEGATLGFTTATFSQKTLDAWKLGVAIRVTEELLYDNNFGLERYILEQFGRALADAEEQAFVLGDGNKKPLGLFTRVTESGADTNSIYSVPISTTSAGVPSLKSDDIFDLVYALKAPYRSRASFIVNDTTLAALRKLKDSNGQYLWQPSYQAGQPDRLVGYVVNTSPHVPSIPSAAPTDADTPVISFGDYGYYYIADRGPRSVAVLRELYAMQGMVGYKMTERVDAKLILPEAVQILYAAKA